MLPEEYELLQELHKQFTKCRDEAIREVKLLWDTKGEDYDVETGIWNRAPFDELSLCHEVYKVALRLVEMMKAVDESDLKFEGIDAKIQDLINYGLAWLAYRKMKRLQTKELDELNGPS
jgi:hypothetical protein